MNCRSVDTVLYLTDSSCKITTLITNVNYLELEWCCWHYVYSWIKITTVFVDTWLWKTKYWWKHFQNFRRSCVLLTDRIEIHQLHVQPLVWPSNLLYIMLSGCDGGFRSDLSITRKTEGNFGNVSVSFFKDQFRSLYNNIELSHASRPAHRLCNLFQNHSNLYSSLL